MSVRTTADEIHDRLYERLENMKQEVRDSLDDINKMLDTESTWGADEWIDEYVEYCGEFEDNLVAFSVSIGRFLRKQW